MWTSSILVIISMFSAEAVGFSESVRDLAAQMREASLVTPEAATADVPTTRIAVAPALVAAKAEAPSAVVSDLITPELIKPDLIAPDFSMPIDEASKHLAISVPTFASSQLMIKVPAPTKAQDIIGKVQNFYNTTNSFTASFSQTVRNTTFSKLKMSIGKVYILKPGKMRWDYKNDPASHKRGGPKVSRSFISDGKHLWAVMHKNKQFYKESLDGSALPVAVSFLMGTGNLLNDFNVTMEKAGKFGSKSDILLLLTPKVPSARYKKLWLVVDPSNYAVKQSVVLNTKGDTNSIVFSKVVLDSGKLRKGHFIFNEAANKDYSHIKPPQD
ncbi:MAG: outer membrane lipoprotein carrier protein LolA [Myxococcales bacterium]|nr:outer membrane lipoprotein carrier protein LolA [Myxococcales bacterium]